MCFWNRTVDCIKMKEKWTSYFVVLCFCLTVFCAHCESLNNRKRKCVFENACRCSFPSGLGLDFSVLGLKNGWFMLAIEPNATLFFHPCSDDHFGPKENVGNDCYCGSSVCLYNATTDYYTNLGRANETSFINEDGLFNPMYLQYNHNNRTTTFRLLCDTDTNDLNNTRLTLSTGNIEENHLKVELMSAALCPGYKPLMLPPGWDAGAVQSGGLSTGSVLCIIYFVFLGIYFLGGAIALRFLRGATGREMIPNVDFWTSLPELIKDGVTFTLNGCRVRQANIYDSI